MGILDQILEKQLENRNLKLGEKESLLSSFKEAEKNYIEAIRHLDRSLESITNNKEIFIINGGIWAICTRCMTQFQIKDKVECPNCETVFIEINKKA